MYDKAGQSCTVTFNNVTWTPNGSAIPPSITPTTYTGGFLTWFSNNQTEFYYVDNGNDTWILDQPVEIFTSVPFLGDRYQYNYLIWGVEVTCFFPGREVAVQVSLTRVVSSYYPVRQDPLPPLDDYNTLSSSNWFGGSPWDFDGDCSQLDQIECVSSPGRDSIPIDDYENSSVTVQL